MRIAPQLERAGPARHSSPVTRHWVKIHIEELVLHGFARNDRHQIAAAVQQELARLVMAARLAPFRENRRALERINAGAFKVKAGAKPQTAGTEIARAVFRSLRQYSRASVNASRTRPVMGGRRA